MAGSPPRSSVEPGDFARVQLVVATVSSARPDPKAAGSALVLELDLGPELGRRTSSARLGADYEASELVGTQVVVVANLPARRVAGVDSEVLVLAAVDPCLGTRLLRLDVPVPNGTRVS